MFRFIPSKTPTKSGILSDKDNGYHAFCGGVKSIFHSSISKSPSSSDESYHEMEHVINKKTTRNREYNEDDWGFFIELDLDNHIHDKIIRKYHNKNIYKCPIDEEEPKKNIYPYPKIEYEMIYYICGVIAFVIFLN